MITDFIDADAVRTHRRKESVYFAVWKSGLKVARALAFVCVGLGLQLMGVDLAVKTVSPQMQLAIVLLFGVFVGVCFILSGRLLYRAQVPEPLQR